MPMSNRNIVITLVVIIILAIGSWGVYRMMQQDSVNSTSQSTNEESMATKQEEPKTNQDQAQCTRDVDQDALKNAKVDIKDRVVTLSVKDFGDITVELYDKDAPKTVENFLRLANSGYYNCITFHRVAKGFVIQGGDPTGTGSGGESSFGGEFADELNPETPSYKAGYKKGVLAMANRGPNTNTSQFFIMLADGQLPHSYTIFGKVSSGLDVVDKIGAVDINPGPFGPTDGSPKTPVVIEKAVIKAK